MNQPAAVIHVIDDDEGVGTALRYLIESIQFEVRAHLSIAEFLDAWRPGGVGCLVLDVRMPGMSGSEFLERRHGLGVDLPVIMLSGHGTVAMAARALRAGAVDFIEKPINEQLLLDRIQEAVEISRRQLSRQALSGRIATLTSRELEVTRLIAAGKHNKEIAQALDLSSRTVEAHRARAMAKLDVHSTADLVALMVQHAS